MQLLLEYQQQNQLELGFHDTIHGLQEILLYLFQFPWRFQSLLRDYRPNLDKVLSKLVRL